MTEADRLFAVNVAAGLSNVGGNLEDLSLSRRRAVLELAARLLAVAEA